MPQPPHDESNNAAREEPAPAAPKNRGDISPITGKERRYQDVMRLWAETGYFHER